MPRTISLVGFRPPARFDAVSWAHVRIGEAAAAAGPFVQIDDQALDPDLDPAQPAARNLTTIHATLPDGWYLLTFVGPDGSIAESEPVRYTGTSENLPPSPDDIRAHSPLLKAKYPPSPVDAEKEAELRQVVSASIAFVQAITCRQLDPTGGCECQAGACQPVPDDMRPLAIRAVTLMAEQHSVTDEVKQARARAGRLRLRGFSAGRYSETYWDPAMVRAGGSGRRPQFIDDPDLDDILWALATEDARALIVAETTGVQPPAGGAQAFDFNKRFGIGRIGNIGPLGPTGGPQGPDGF